ncbi:hypothetical protein COV61_01475 [Candidatus Micrarchaeota archaeon CG11_big_fil_rev_8_21_14_0_20_47_5]|nr:MAG: hypothetical protein AUJ17_01405 [Candidatus Micrarchaeota archaeon CG1_02_47_40]PIN83991.1 MAG: hypothetical protein COV61_01475 [Candidatus Micrarchaeota archaeon CG11_big_fil_rev_8_21_14_0_20_47_5]
MKNSFSALFGVFLLLFSAGISFAVSDCSDLTKYGECSTTIAGKYCTGYPAPTLQDYASKCGCTAVAGYTVDPADPDKCVALETGCANNNPACGADYNCVSNACVKKAGCQYLNPPCNPDETCTSNACVKKSGCEFSNPPCPTGKMCQSNECVSLGGTPTPPPVDNQPDTTPSSNSIAGPDLLVHEPRNEGFACCASSLAILFTGMFAAFKKSE